MLARLAADLLVLSHLAFIAFVVGGGFLAWRWRRLVWVHVPVAFWGALVEITGWLCPLTVWEQSLRRVAGQAGYTESFVEHYFLPILYPAGLTRQIQFALAAVVILVNAIAYTGYVRRRPRPD
jgi:hypothetical protein